MRSHTEFITSTMWKKKEGAAERHFILETILTVLIELSSLADFASDVVILVALANSPDTAWFSFALFTMICPYYTVYTSLMTFQIQDTRKRIEQN